MSELTTSKLPSVEERFLKIQNTLQSEQFLKREGIGGEVPFFIFAYEAKLETTVDKELNHLISRLEKNGITLQEINLYDLVVELIQDRNKWDRLLKAEMGMNKDKFKTQLQNLSDVETKLIPKIAEKISTQDGLQLLLITGVGMVFPFIRTHNVLSNLQRIAKDYPTLLLFPGKYTFTEGRGQSLDLFGEMNEDKYYRAHNIENLGR